MSLPLNFAEVLSAARAGSDSAWAAIYQDLAPTVRGYLAARGADEPDDLVGEAFLQVVRDISSFEGDERQFRAWVFTIAHHRLMDEKRRASRRPFDPTPELVLEVEAAVGDAEEEALGELTQTEIEALFARLSPDQRSVLLLRVVGDLSVDQTAHVLGKRPGAVKSLQRRGLEALRKEISVEGVTL